MELGFELRLSGSGATKSHDDRIELSGAGAGGSRRSRSTLGRRPNPRGGE